MISDVFIELSIIILITLFVVSIIRLLRQPLIIGYIVAGVIVGPYMLNVMSSSDTIHTFAQMGVALLLFMVGINLDLKLIRDIGGVALFTGLGQVLFTFVIGFMLSSALGFSLIESIYIAVALTFSSTIIIMKLLSDKGDMQSLYGRISVGFLIVQDLVAVVLLILVSASASGESWSHIATSALTNGVILTVGLLFITFYLFPRITKSIVRNQEFLLLFVVGWCLVISSLFAYFGFSFEVGALLAGMSLSMSPYIMRLV